MTHPSLHDLDHRPWPLPGAPWTWRQSWLDLLFAHWPIDVRVLQPLVPPVLRVQEFEGTSWIGLVPFGLAFAGLEDQLVVHLQQHAGR